jgi:hypothetical protein
MPDTFSTAFIDTLYPSVRAVLTIFEGITQVNGLPMTNFNSLVAGYQEVASPYTRFKTLLPVDVYKDVRKFIIKSLAERGEITMQELLDLALEGFAQYGDKTNWYVLKVKLDMEAKKEIRVKKPVQTSIPRLRLAPSCRK